MRVENRAGLSPASQIPEYRDYEASTNLSSIRGFVRVLLWGGTRIRTFWNRYRTIVSRYLTVKSFESRQIVDTDPVPRGILTQVHSHDDLFQLGRADGTRTQHCLNRVTSVPHPHSNDLCYEHVLCPSDLCPEEE